MGRQKEEADPRQFSVRSLSMKGGSGNGNVTRNGRQKGIAPHILDPAMESKRENKKGSLWGLGKGQGGEVNLSASRGEGIAPEGRMVGK